MAPGPLTVASGVSETKKNDIGRALNRVTGPAGVSAAAAMTCSLCPRTSCCLPCSLRLEPAPRASGGAARRPCRHWTHRRPAAAPVALPPTTRPRPRCRTSPRLHRQGRRARTTARDSATSSPSQRGRRWERLRAPSSTPSRPCAVAPSSGRGLLRTCLLMTTRWLLPQTATAPPGRLRARRPRPCSCSAVLAISRSAAPPVAWSGSAPDPSSAGTPRGPRRLQASRRWQPVLADRCRRTYRSRPSSPCCQGSLPGTASPPHSSPARSPHRRTPQSRPALGPPRLALRGPSSTRLALEPPSLSGRLRPRKTSSAARWRPR
mmetsp:Transcript_11899/g.31883  ORF Transcript_11899/g.31883 Transcript_11899/m.31883 type:complete len:320 (+) Transcript_11899:22-981(+)